MEQNIPKTFVIGADGFIGYHLLKEYQKTYTLSSGSSNRTGNNLVYLDMMNPEIDMSLLVRHGYEFAVICAGVSNIELCEKEPELTWKINVTGVIAVIRQLLRYNIIPVYLSSDQVFDGKHNHPYTETDAVLPINEYGKQKVFVESFLKENTKSFIIARLSKVFSVYDKKQSFLYQSAVDLMENKIISAATDLFFSPVNIDNVIQGITALQRKKIMGLVHICSPDVLSRYELISKLCRLLGKDTDLIQKISMDEIYGKARYPKNIAMSCDKLVDKTGLKPYDMEKNLRWLAANIKKNG